MKRMICLDVGDKRIGVAVSDPLFVTAQGVETYERKKMSVDLAYLSAKAKELGADVALIGLPKNMDGSVGPQAEKIQAFAEKFRKRSGLEIRFFDERLTTCVAQQVLLEADVSRDKRKKVVDKMAAVVILQSYLDSMKSM